MSSARIALIAGVLVGAIATVPADPPAVALNHLYIVVDTETYEAIHADSFLKEKFAAYEERTTTRTDRTYTGMYFYGTNTYFEFFDAGNPGNGPRGMSGIAFGVDHRGDLASLEKKLSRQFTVETGPITRLTEAGQVPWFTILSVDAPMRLATWLMEYDSEFLRQWKPQAGGSRDGIRRRDILARYTASLGKSGGAFLLNDVAGIIAAVDPQTRESIRSLCAELGHQIETSGGDLVIRGPEFWLRLIDETEALHGIRQIRFRVRRAKASSRRVGRSTLDIRGDGTADWSFDPFSSSASSKQVRFYDLLPRSTASVP
jgi:hypothetical protein